MRKKRETEKHMVNKTPLRVVPIGELPPAEDDHSATPTVMMPEHDAITKRMPEPPAGMPGEWRRYLHWKLLVPMGGLLLALVLVIVALATRGKGGATAPAPATAIAPSQVPAAPPAAPVLAPPPAPAAPSPAPAAKAVAETIRLEIAADPVETELSLDGNVVAGHRLNIEVPRDRGIHLISATAAGYLPFNQQVSFGSDVVLNISLRRGHAPAVRQATRTRSAPAENRAKSAAARTGAAWEPGMSLEAPPARPNAKAIDERNPYKP
jgi:hypothetical protein